jgi:hypothetical protein
MVPLADAWYKADLTWTIATFASGLLIGVLAVWATLRASYPNLRVSYRLDSVTKLIATDAVQGSLAVTYNGTAVRNPHLAVMTLTNSGRRDITADMFHNGDPTVFEFDEHIVAPVEWQVTPPTHLAMPLRISGRGLLVDPTLLRRKQSLTVTLLFDGPVTDLTVQPSLVNVDVRPARDPRMALDRAAIEAVGWGPGPWVVSVLSVVARGFRPR